MIVESHLDGLNEMLKKRGLEKNGRTQKLLTAECARYMDKYVPMDTGILKNTRIIGTNSVTYNTPYARMMYYGKVMVDPKTGAAGFLTDKGWRSRKGVEKIESSREFDYRGAPQRGKLWDEKMWRNHSTAILNAVAKSAGGTAK